MSLSLKNSSSNSSKVVSEGILQYLLMLIIALWWIIPGIDTSTAPSKGIILVELEDYMGPSDIEGLLNQFKSDENIIASTVEYIPKHKALALMEGELNSQLLSEAGINNPFRDVVRFEMSNNIGRDDILTKAGIHDVFIQEVRTSTSIIKGLSLGFAIPLTIVFCILLIVYFKRYISEIVGSNKEVFESFMTYGAESQYVRQSLNQSVTKVSLRAWFIAILLFVCTIYLLLGILDIKIINFSIVKLVVCTLISFIIVLLIKRWMVGKILTRNEL